MRENPPQVRIVGGGAGLKISFYLTPVLLFYLQSVTFQPTTLSWRKYLTGPSLKCLLSLLLYICQEHLLLLYRDGDIYDDIGNGTFLISFKNVVLLYSFKMVTLWLHLVLTDCIYDND